MTHEFKGEWHDIYLFFFCSWLRAKSYVMLFAMIFSRLRRWWLAWVGSSVCHSQLRTLKVSYYVSLIARLMGSTWGPHGADRPHMGPILAPWTSLSWIIDCKDDLLLLWDFINVTGNARTTCTALGREILVIWVKSFSQLFELPNDIHLLHQLNSTLPVLTGACQPFSDKSLQVPVMA